MILIDIITYWYDIIGYYILLIYSNHSINIIIKNITISYINTGNLNSTRGRFCLSIKLI